MTEEFVNLRSRKNPKARIKLMGGHFATMNSHVNTYIDMSTVKTRHNNARETAATLAEEYKTGTMVETIVCLKNTEVIGAFMAEHLADTGRISMSAGNNISVVTPEFDTMGQILSFLFMLPHSEADQNFTRPNVLTIPSSFCPSLHSGQSLAAYPL